MDLEVPFRIRVVSPVPGLALGLRGKGGEIKSRQVSPDGSDLVFDFSLRVRRVEGDPAPRFLGEFADGPVGARFVYLRIGTHAGQADSPYGGAMKIPLGSISWDLVDAAGGRGLEVRVSGRGRKGGPAYATVPLLDCGWRVAD